MNVQGNEGEIDQEKLFEVHKGFGIQKKWVESLAKVRNLKKSAAKIETMPVHLWCFTGWIPIRASGSNVSPFFEEESAKSECNTLSISHTISLVDEKMELF